MQSNFCHWNIIIIYNFSEIMIEGDSYPLDILSINESNLKHAS